jgi:hypothetical protein
MLCVNLCDPNVSIIPVDPLQVVLYAKNTEILLGPETIFYDN